MKLPIRPPYPPMAARLVEQPPAGPQWQYEPKWDGFRCLAFRDGDEVYLQSKAGQPLARYFPELVAVLGRLRAKRFLLDGEIVIPVAGRLSFDDLLMRVHPAASRVLKLSHEYPATLIVFDLLVNERGVSIVDRELAARREALERFAARYFEPGGQLRLSPMTTKLPAAQRWFQIAGPSLDGIVAKRRDLNYRSGLRDGMEKIKHRRTADCVVAGLRYASKHAAGAPRLIGSLLLGLYNEQGLLDHVGFTSSFSAGQRREITRLLKPLVGGTGFSGKAPGGPSRWSTRRSDEWVPLDPQRVVEVQYDHFTNGRFRHGTKLLRWRPDKSPAGCTIDQVDRRSSGVMKLLKPPTRGRKPPRTSRARA